MSAVLIVDKYFSKCSACNGNADPSERQHIHGGPGSGYRAGSALSDTNGCGATFMERYYVADCRTEAIDTPWSSAGLLDAPAPTRSVFDEAEEMETPEPPKRPGRPVTIVVTNRAPTRSVEEEKTNG